MNWFQRVAGGLCLVMVACSQPSGPAVDGSNADSSSADGTMVDVFADLDAEAIADDSAAADAMLPDDVQTPDADVVDAASRLSDTLPSDLSSDAGSDAWNDVDASTDAGPPPPVMLPWQTTPTCAPDSRKMCGMTGLGGKPFFASGLAIGPDVDKATLGQPGQELPANAIIHDFLPEADKARANDHPNEGSLDEGIWTYWHPFRLQMLPNGHVRLQAIWLNQFYTNGIAPNDLSNCNSPKITGCMGVEPDLIPSGCVTIDIDVQSARPVAVAFDLERAEDWYKSWQEVLKNWTPQPYLEPFRVVEKNWRVRMQCATKAGISYLPSKPISLKLPDGRTLVAHTGRSKWEAVMDPKADSSVLVRDVFGKNKTVLQKPVVEILPLGAQKIGLEPVAVPMDLSICRIPAAEVPKAGCACPKAGWPPSGDAKGQPTGTDWAVVEVLGTKTKYIADVASLSATQGSAFTGAGYKKYGDVPMSNGYTAKGPCLKAQVSACNLSKQVDQPAFANWSCGGTQKTSAISEPEIGLRLIGGMNTKLAPNLYLSMKCDLRWLKTDMAMLKQLPATYPPSSWNANTKNGCRMFLYDGISISTPAIGQRARAWDSVVASASWVSIVNGYNHEDFSQFSEIKVVNYGPKHLEVDVLFDGYRTRYGVTYSPTDPQKPPPTPTEDPDANVQRVKIRVRARFSIP